MKIFNLCFVFALFFSCSVDSDTVFNPVFPKERNIDSYLSRGIVDSASNANNPNDSAGSLFSTLFKTYYATDSLSATLVAVSSSITLLANANVDFVGLQPSIYLNNTNARVQYILQNGSCCFENILNSSLSNATTRTNFQTFLTSFTSQYAIEPDYWILHSFIIDYEDEVLNNKSISIEDQTTILTTTSLLRYVTYERKKRPKKNTDPDWDLLVWSIAGSLDGTSTGTQDAIVMALICGIMENDF